jgi:TrmH family RNA methyltransferase
VIRQALAGGVGLELLALGDGVSFSAPAERTIVLGRRALAAVSRTVTPQGVLAVVRWETVSMSEAMGAARTAGWPLVVLDGVQDPGNVGTICRSAAAAGAPALAVLDGGADPLGSKAVRASAGCVFRLAVARGGWEELAGLSGFAASPAGGVPLESAELEGGGLLALGGETRGVRRRDLDAVTVPMAPGVESLNVAAAAAILLFELKRRRERRSGPRGVAAAAEGAA